MSTVKTAGVKRVRRTPEQARALILDAAEAIMGMRGPGGLRLTQVAAEAGVSHPTLLHHFGSREGLVQALYQRTLAGLRTALVGVLQNPDMSSKDVIGLVFRAYRDGLAQRLVWMLQTEGAETGTGGLEPPAGGLPIMEAMVRELTAVRARVRPDLPAPEADTRALIHLTTIAAFGDALIGRRIRAAGSVEEEAAARERFEQWFGVMMDRHVTAGLR